MNPRFFKVHRPGWVKKMTDGSLKKKIEDDSKKAQQSYKGVKKTGDKAFRKKAKKKWKNVQKNWKESSDSYERDKKALRRMMDDSRKELEKRKVLFTFSESRHIAQLIGMSKNVLDNIASWSDEITLILFDETTLILFDKMILILYDKMTFVSVTRIFLQKINYNVHLFVLLQAHHSKAFCTSHS